MSAQDLEQVETSRERWNVKTAEVGGGVQNGGISDIPPRADWAVSWFQYFCSWKQTFLQGGASTYLPFKGQFKHKGAFSDFPSHRES